MTQTDPHSRLATALLFAIGFAAALLPAPVSAKALLGDFVPFQSWWIHPVTSSLGIFYDGNLIRIDRDGDSTAESLFLRPTGQTGIPNAAISSLRLTPSRTIVYAFGGTCNSNGTLVYFYHLPASLSDNRLEPILTGLCIPHGILRPPGFYDTGTCAFNGLGLDCTGHLGVSPRRVALFVTNADEFGFLNLIWVDLSTGVVSGPNFDFKDGLGFIEVSPSGTQAFLQHDLPISGETDYRLIDLCPGPNFGVVINPGGFPIVDSSEQLHAAVTAATAGNVTVEVTNPFDVVRDSADFADCLDTSGACCFDGGSCAQLQPASCSGTYLGAATACSECPAPPVEAPCCFPEGNPTCTLLEASVCTDQGGAPQPGANFCSFDLCPQPETTLAISGPASAQIGDNVSYLLDYENTGGVVARGVEIEIPVPFGATFVSATGGGDETSGAVRWVLGDVAPGASGSVGVTFAVGCDAADFLLQGYISHEPPLAGRSYSSSNEIDVTATPLPTAALAVSVASVPDHEPLRPGDELVHTITLRNASGTSVENVKLGRSGEVVPTGVSFGSATSFDRTLDAGGGLVDTTDGRFAWTGDVGAGQTVSIRYVAQVNSCVPPGTRTTQLEFGNEIAAFDACNTELGKSALPQSFAVEPLAHLELEASNLAPAQRLDAPVIDSKVQLTRPNGVAQIDVTLQSNAGQALAGASIDLTLRGLNVMTPPTGPGIVFDASNHSIAWDGTIPSSGRVTISFAGNVSACRAEIRLEGSTSAGCSDLRDELLVAAVPQPPAGPWLAAIGTQPHPFEAFGSEQQIVRVEPGPPGQMQTMLCLPSEYYTGMAAAPDGSIWSAWLPTFRVNPAALEFESFDLDALEATGLDSLSDIAIDPVDGAVYFSGYRFEITGNFAILARRDPVTKAVTSYYQNDTFQGFGQMVVDASGSIIAVATRRFGPGVVVRIDPGTPPTIEVYEGVGLPIDVALDQDGSYVVIDGFANPAQLRDVDPATTNVAAILGNLATAFPGSSGWNAVEVDAAGRVYVAPSQSGLGAVDRTPATSTQSVLPFGFAQTGGVLDMAMVSLPIPEPNTAALALVAITSLGALVVRGKRRTDAAVEVADGAAHGVGAWTGGPVSLHGMRPAKAGRAAMIGLGAFPIACVCRGHALVIRARAALATATGRQ